jgi:hypothetical protein
MEKVSRREALIRLGIVAGGAVAYSALNSRVWAGDSKGQPKNFDRPLTAITLGAGNRGTLYGDYATL